MEISIQEKRNLSKKEGFLFWIIALSIILLGIIVGAIDIGSTDMEAGEVYKG